MQIPATSPPSPPAHAASPPKVRKTGAPRERGASRAVLALLIAVLSWAPACSSVLHDAGEIGDIYGRGESRQPAQDRDEKRASAQDDLYDREGRKGTSDDGLARSRARRGSDLYGTADVSGDRRPALAEKGTEATEPLYESKGGERAPGAAETGQRPKIARAKDEEDDLYGVSQTASRRGPPEKTEGPTAERGAEQPSGPPPASAPGREKTAGAESERQPSAETKPVSVASVPAPSPAKEQEAGRQVAVSTPAPAAVPPSPAPGKEAVSAPVPSVPPPAKEQAAGGQEAVSKPAPPAVPPSPAPGQGAVSAPVPSVSVPEKAAGEKVTMPAAEVAAATAGPAAPERDKPRPTQGRSSTAVTATQKKQVPAYPEQRRETEDILELGREKREPPEGLLVVNRPPNIQGLTGLLFTNSAYTLPAGKLAVGASFLTEYSNRPEFSVLQIPVTVTYGLTDRVEMGLKAKIVDLDSPSYLDRAHGFGDSEVAVKWRFASQRFILPDMAVGLCYILPTGNERKHLNEVVNWGAKFMAIASLEGKTAGGRVFGVYAESQAVFIDELIKSGSSTPGAERYGVLNGGVLFPVSEDNRLQLIAEYNQILYKSSYQPTMIEGNQNAGTAAIRYVTEQFSVTAGLQYLNKEKSSDQNTYRFVWKFSLTL